MNDLIESVTNITVCFYLCNYLIKKDFTKTLIVLIYFY